MTRFARYTLILLGLAAITVFFPGCPVMENPGGLWISGKINISSTIQSQNYSAVCVNVYTPQGDFISKTDISGSGSPLGWNMELFVPQGTRVTFWVELQNQFDSELYFAPGQEDIITSGNAYDWTVNEIKVPIFNEADLRKIGTIYPGSQDFVLVSDIQLKDSWEPLCHPGSTSASFSGSFDGNGRTISELRFDDGSDQFIGLFASVKGSASKHSVIKNIKIVLAEATLNLSGINEQKVGFAIAEAQDTDIDHISVIGPGTGMNITKNNGNALYAGGIVATLAGRSTVSRCSSSIPLTIESPSVSVAAVGGLIGKLDSVTMPSNITSGNIYRSYSSAAISVTLRAASAAAYAGGIAGGATSNSALWFEECYTSGNISINSPGTFAVGGMVGGANSTRTSSSPPLFFSRSVVMMKEINIALGTGNFRMISGDGETYVSGSSPSAPAPIPPSAYQAPLPMRNYASDITYIHAPTASEGGILRSNLTNDRFFQPILSGGMNWDSNQTWKWDTAKGRPVFQWE
jgi:hypothetical protein